MNPNEYDVMVEHLANEIIDDVMEKEAAPRQKRIESYQNMYKGPNARKLIDAYMDRQDSRVRRAELRTALKKAKKDKDSEEESKIRGELANEKSKKWKAIGTNINPMNHLRAGYEQLSKATASQLLPTYGNMFDADAGKQLALRDIAAERAQKTAAYEDEIMGYVFEKSAECHEPNFVRDIPNKVRRQNAKKAGYPTPTAIQAAKGLLSQTGDSIKAHPYRSAAIAATIAAAPATLAALKAKKKKKEEEKEKVAAYYDDAMIKMAAAENVYDYADYHDDEYEAMLMKQAAEEVYSDAMAQAEAAENVYNAIDDIDYEADDAEYIDEADYE